MHPTEFSITVSHTSINFIQHTVHRYALCEAEAVFLMSSSSEHCCSNLFRSSFSSFRAATRVFSLSFMSFFNLTHQQNYLVKRYNDNNLRNGTAFIARSDSRNDYHATRMALTGSESDPRFVLDLADASEVLPIPRTAFYKYNSQIYKVSWNMIDLPNCTVS